MNKTCNNCTSAQKKNKHQLQLSYLSVTYQNADMIKSPLFPRKYTTTHNDYPPKLFVSIGHDYDTCLLNSEEVIKQKTQVTGKWVKNDFLKQNHLYEIHFKVIVSDSEHTDATARNEEFCKYMSTVLETVGYAESALLKSHPKLADTKIYIHFTSIDSSYNRVEYWNRLGYWAYKK